MKNYKYVFCFLLDVSITNALILHSFDVRSGPTMDQKHFRLMLAEQLIGTYMSPKRAGRPRKRPPSTAYQQQYSYRTFSNPFHQASLCLL